MAEQRKKNIMGISALPSEWDKDDDKAVGLWISDLAKKRNWHANPEDWPRYDEYLGKCTELRVAAKQIAADTGEQVWNIWGTIKKRAIQEQDGVLQGMFPLSDHYDRKIRRAYAEAATAHPRDPDARQELAKVLFMEKSDSRTEDAWHAFHYTQLSLFKEVHAGAERLTGSKEPTMLHEVLADPTPAGTDPADAVQLSFLDSVLDEAGLSDRIKDVAEMLADGYKPAEIARRLVPPVSPQTVGRDMEKIAKYHHGWLNDIPFGLYPEEVMDDDQDS